jgi:tetratricopeptide (TPR) repeat protein
MSAMTCCVPTHGNWRRPTTASRSGTQRFTGCWTTTCTPGTTPRRRWSRSSTRSGWDRRSPASPPAARQPPAVGYAKSGRVAASIPPFHGALRLFAATGDHASQAIIHRHLSWIANRQTRPAEMLDHSLQSLELFRLAEHPAGQAMYLQDVGHAHALLGNYEQAITYCESALAAMRAIGERRWEGAVWDSLGCTYHHRGDHQQAITCYERAIDLSRELADRFNQADTLSSLGDVHHSAGDLPSARRAWAHALQIFDEIDHPDADQVRGKLRSAGPQAATVGLLAAGA